MSPLSSTWGARKTELELPEEIDLQVEVANVGSRSLAILIDLGLGGLVLFIVYCLTLFFPINGSGNWLTEFSSSTLKVLLLGVLFGFQWCYFNVFEWLWNGQTPGKRLLHLRVIKADGSPVSGIDILLRNFSRPIDTLGPMGLLGLMMIFVSRKAQRLGDMMAGTIVIHETVIDWSLFDQIESLPASSGTMTTVPAIRLNSEQWELLHRYLNRREHLEKETREKLASHLYDVLKPLAKGTALELSTLSPESWLLELARRT